MYALAIVFEGVTEKDYWAVNDELGIARDGSGDWPVGLRSHHGGPTANGWVVFEVWDSKAEQEAWMGGRLGAALAVVAVPAPVQVIETNTVNDQHPNG